MRARVRLLLGSGVEAFAWGGLSAGFLYLYVVRFSVPAVALWPHAKLILLLIVCVAILRLSVHLAGASPAWSRLVGTLVLAIPLFMLASYYALVLIGMQSWGRVVSLDLIASYATQARQLFAVLEIPIAAFLAAAAGLLAWIVAVWLFLGHFDWARESVRLLGVPVAVLCIAGGSVIVGAGTYQFLAYPPISQHEPVSLTLFPMAASRDLQGHAIDTLRAQRLDLAEDRARAAYIPSPGFHRTNVILIIVDALRPDHMGVYGYGRATTPNLAKLQDAGIVRKAGITHASCASSACGLLSLASSKYVHQFSERPFTLQQVLKRHGYRIHMMLSGDHTSYYSLKEAYGQVDSYFDGYSGRHYRTYYNDDQIVLDKLADFPESDGTAVMFQFHLMSAHLLGKRHAASMKYLPAASYAFPPGRDADANGVPGPGNVNYYDNGVLQTDRVILSLLDTLKRKRYLDDALVAVTADHGEGLGEHGVFQHASDVYEQTLRVPFLLLSYGREPRQALDAKPFVSQVDIAPTILAELGMPVPQTWSGISMHTPHGKPFTYFQERTKVGVIDHRDTKAVWKYWTNSATGREFAFDLVADPNEARNAIAHVRPDLLVDWRRQILPGLSVQVLPEDSRGMADVAR